MSKVASSKLKTIGRYGRNVLAFYGALSLTAPLIAIAVLKKREKDAEIPPESLWLEIDFSKQLVEGAGASNPLHELLHGDQELRVADVVEALRRAGADRRVRGVVGRFEGAQWPRLALASAQEVREAVLAFRAAGGEGEAAAAAGGAAAGAGAAGGGGGDRKFTVALADSFGEAGMQGLAEYYVASAFQDVRLGPSGLLGIMGLGVQVPFLREALDRYGVRPQFTAREEYKNAANGLTQRGFTRHHRKATEGLLRGLLGEVVAGAARARGVPEARVQALIDLAPLRPPDAQAAGLVDRVQYSDDALRAAVFPRVFRELLRLRGEVARAQLAAGQCGAQEKKDGKFIYNAESGKEAFIEFNSKYLMYLSNAAESNATDEKRAKEEAMQENVVEVGVVVTPGSSGGEGTLEARMAVGPPAAAAAGAAALRRQLEVLDAAAARGRAGRDPELACLARQKVSLKEYLASMRKAEEKERKEKLKKSFHERISKLLGWTEEGPPPRKTVAIIHLSGAIERAPAHGTKPSFNDQDPKILSGPACAAIRRAALDPEVAAVVLRIDSPGGSALASDCISRAIEDCKRVSGVPVYCSMANYAASGGYMIAAACDRIWAQPTTVTGSIGVIAGKLTFQRFLARYGVRVDGVAFGRNAAALSPLEDFDAAQLARLDEDVDLIYEDFLAKVARGRRMAVEEVRRVAKGRVWTGREALGHGLVDELGGLRQAVEAAAAAAGLDLEGDPAARARPYPPPPSLEDRLRRLLLGPGGGGGGGAAEGALLGPLLGQGAAAAAAAGPVLPTELTGAAGFLGALFSTLAKQEQWSANDQVPEITTNNGNYSTSCRTQLDRYPDL